MKNIFKVFVFLTPMVSFGQSSFEEIIKSNQEFQMQMNKDYADEKHSPLKEEDRLNFKSLPFFEIDTSFCVNAKFKKDKKLKAFAMKTTTDRNPIYAIYGTAYFSINEKEFELKIYQSHNLREKEEYKNHLFLPFTDLSSGEESYGGGRFIDLLIPEGDRIIIDFNKAYNPYCAYNYKYSCPIPPRANFIKIKVLAGVKSPH